MEKDEKLIKFWDSMFANYQGSKIELSEFKVENSFDELLKFIGDNCEKVLEVGSGMGFSLIQCKVTGSKVTDALGIDPSKEGIRYSRQTCELSNIKNIEFMQSDDNTLVNMNSEGYDGIICSNVLDVVPEITSERLIKEMSRVVKKDGYILLKFNFELNDEIAAKCGLVSKGNNEYYKDEILRGVNHPLNVWVEKFKGFEVVKEDTYQRAQGVPKDRLLLLKKK